VPWKENIRQALKSCGFVISFMAVPGIYRKNLKNEFEANSLNSKIIWSNVWLVHALFPSMYKETKMEPLFKIREKTDKESETNH